MIEQDMASIINFVLGATDHPTPYYWDIPETFQVPAMYFPRPEVDSGPETMDTYYMDQTMYIKIIASTTEDAMDLGRAAIRAIRKRRNLIPLIKEKDGAAKELVEEYQRSRNYVRVNDPECKRADECTCQLTVSWRTREPYDHIDIQKMMKFHVEGLGRDQNTYVAAHPNDDDRFR